MDMFYGGKRGYSFILKPNPDNTNGYWASLAAIQSGAREGKLKYGEYAIITTDTSNGNVSKDHGKIYRIQESNKPVLVGRIGNPAPFTGITIGDSDGTEEFRTIPFLPETPSKTVQGVKCGWKNITDENGDITSIGLSFDFPQPVIDVISAQSNNMEEGKSGIILQKSAPYYYGVKVISPPNIYIGTSVEQNGFAQFFNNGDLWLQVFNGDRDYEDIQSYNLRDYTLQKGESQLIVPTLNLTVINPENPAMSYNNFSCELQLDPIYNNLFDSFRIAYKINNSGEEFITKRLEIGTDNIYNLESVFSNSNNEIDISQGLILTRMTVWSSTHSSIPTSTMNAMFPDNDITQNIISFTLTFYNQSTGGV